MTIDGREQYLNLLKKRVCFKYDEDEPKPFIWTGEVTEVNSDHLIIFEERKKTPKGIYFKRIVSFDILPNLPSEGRQ